ncbi:hypothetical protein MAPG_04140 [Magnaporthiopsis poae ATCC 64411]|uniref:F-box domain-containing protein n=1 Tax=Magnaporthiopsis poae (strain ATCC 64411 / 73-15) TaxID=644358 RepID=A0A0C4DVX5_MAGP6|nr:hypothetical protein MAPG_04140 [Magnaporthiopsis poae ATCC 64411]
MPNAHLANVSAEIRSLILSELPKEALLACRLVCRILSVHTTPLAFRHVLLTARHAASADSFIRICEAEHLRQLVHEVTCDTYVGDWCRYRGGKGYKVPAAFLAALPYMRHLRSLRSLNIFFSKYTARRNVDMRYPTNLGVAETTDFRFRVLNMIFEALRGTWHKKMWIPLFLDLHLPQDDFSPNVDDEKGDGDGEGPIELASLAISNLSDFIDRRLMRSRAFQEILAAPSLKSLKLLITHWEKEIEPELRLELPDLYEVYENLPLTWLKPAVAQKLTTLSLYDRHYFGWCPKLDLRLINPDGGLPNLRVLALGHYVFSHDWQVDWVAGLGSLQELYLDDCPILWRAIVRPPLDDENYPTAEAFNAGPNNDRVEIGLPLRWHAVLWVERDAGVLLLDDDEIGIQFGVHTRALDEAALEDLLMSLTKAEVLDI